MSRYRRSLRRGDQVGLYGTAAAFADLRCWNRCTLYFLDLMPTAHFAHPTVIGLYDRVTGDLQIAESKWWPIINRKRHVLDTVDERIKSSVAEQPGKLFVPSARSRRAPSVVRPTVSIPQPLPGPTVFMTGPPGVCKVRSVIVNGFDDVRDSFDEDTVGMYEILTGLGVPDSQIEFVSPIETRGRDEVTSVENIESAIKKVAAAVAAGAPCEEFLLFISSHGDDGAIEVKSHFGEHFFLEAEDLHGWLSSLVGCSRWTVVIEACESGSLKDEIEAAAPTGTAVRFFLSAGRGTSSFGDVDGTDDLNPDDIGSETIWGYIEAFGTSEADLAPTNGKISFHEAVEYAIAKDVTTIAGRHPVVKELNPPNHSPAHSCCEFGATPDLSIIPCGIITKRRKSVGVFGMSQVVPRCTNTPIWITIHNRGTSTIPVGTLRLHGSVIAQDEVLPSSLTAYANVVLVTDLKPGERRTYKVRWGVRPVFKKGDRVALFASIDSPLDPVGADQCIASGPGPEACQADQQSCLCEVSVVKRCFPIVGCNCRTYVGPEP